MMYVEKIFMPVSIDNGGYRSFGWVDPTSGKTHNGHDFNCPLNTQVVAVCSGDVVFSGAMSGFGGLNPSLPGGITIIKHERNDKVFYAVYGHITTNVKIGKKVKGGEVIGFVAKFINGGVLCPHLHFSIWDGISYPPAPYGYVADIKKWVNPVNFIKAG